MIAWNQNRQQWVKSQPERDLSQNIADDYALAYLRYDEMCNEGIDAHDPKRATLDAYLTGLEQLLDWRE